MDESNNPGEESNQESLPAFDTGEGLESRFGVNAGQMVRDPNGNSLMVVGVHNGELYFLRDGRYVLSYWGGFERTDFDAANFDFSSTDESVPTVELTDVPVMQPIASSGVTVFRRMADSLTSVFDGLRSSGTPIEVEDVESSKPDDIYLPIEINENTGLVTVLDVQIPLGKGGERVPKLDKKLLEYTFDERTLVLLSRIAIAVSSRDPCLLMGEPATSKTSGIELLAGLTDHEFDIISLNGAADTSDLIGRFVPNDESSRIKYESMLAQPKELHPESLEILETAHKEGRELTLEESEKIASREGIIIDDSDWRWKDGKIPTAMKEGRWIVLDEVNLAETQILERLNPVLGRFPSLVITEHNGETISEGGDDELHPDFRIFATGNPAEHQGRNILSPAYKDRWTTNIFVESPTEDQLLSMMTLGVFGEHPLVEIRGVMYRALDVEPRYPSLANVPHIREIIRSIAKFHAKIAQMGSDRVIGKSEREPYLYTRRALTELLEFIGEFSYIDRKTRSQVTILDNPMEIINRAIEQYYTEKISSQDDLEKIHDILSAIGISRDNWTIGVDGDTEASGEPTKSVEFFKDFDSSDTWKDKSGESITVCSSDHELELKGISFKPGCKFVVAGDTKGTVFESLGILPNEGLVYAGSFHNRTSGWDRVVFIRQSGEAIVIDPESQEYKDLMDRNLIEEYINPNSQTFRGFRGEKLRSSGEESIGGIKIGDVLKPIVGKLVEEVYRAKKLEVVGFTRDGKKVIVQMDGGDVLTTELGKELEYFKKI